MSLAISARREFAAWGDDGWTSYLTCPHGVARAIGTYETYSAAVFAAADARAAVVCDDLTCARWRMANEPSRGGTALGASSGSGFGSAS